METPSNVFNNGIEKNQNDIVKNYINDLKNLRLSLTSTAEKILTINKAFETDLQQITALNQNTEWMKPGNTYFLYLLDSDVCLLGILPLAGLKIMASIPNSELNMSLLSYYHEILRYSHQKPATFQDKTIVNLPDIVDSVAFLLEQKGIQEKLAFLPQNETLNPDARNTTFTQEKLSELLFLCFETNTTQGREVFEQHASRIKPTPDLLSSVISSYSDEAFKQCNQRWIAENPLNPFPQKVLNNMLTQYVSAVDALTPNGVTDPEKVKTTTDAFERAIKRIFSVNQNIRWEKSDNYCWLSEGSEQNFFLRNILPLSGLTMMASFPNVELDLSLLDNCLQALVCGVVKDKKVSNLSNVLDIIAFLLEQKGMQEKLALLPREERVDPNVRYLTFTQEKLTQLLLLCRETNLNLGLAIFERSASNIQVTPELLSVLAASTSSHAVFQWCAERWIAENPKRQFPKEVMVNMLNNPFAIYLHINNNFYNQQATLKTATETFKSSLKKIVTLNTDVKWDSLISLAPPAHLCIGEAVLLSNVLSLATLEAMQVSSPNVFDASLLMQYFKALDYCRKNSDVFKNKEILNLPDTLNAIDFLLKKKEIQAQLTSLPTEESAIATNQNNMETNVFTIEKFTQLSLLCHELSPEKSPTIFAQSEVKTETSAYLLASLALWTSNAPFEKYAQPLAGNLPDDIVSWLIKKYTAEIDSLNDSSLFCPENKVSKKIEEASTCFKVGLSRISAISQQKPLICRRQDFIDHISLHCDKTQSKYYLHGILPIEAIQLLRKQANIQFETVLFMNYLSKLVYLKEDERRSYKKNQAPKKIMNYDLLLENIRFLMQDLDTEQVINGLQSTEGCLVGLLGMHILQLPEFYKPIYEKFCTINEKKTPTVQKYLIAAILKSINELKDLKLITLFSKHPHASISPKFLKICAKLDYYEGLTCILGGRPEFLENLPISNKMLNNPQFEAMFKQRLKAKIVSHKDENKNTAESHVFSEETLLETFNILHAIPNIYITDMMSAIIQIIQFKQLLHDSTQNVIDLAFGSFLSIWNKKGILHPDPLAVSKNGESLLGSFYGYDSELYTYLLTKLRAMLPFFPQDEQLSLEHKQFCFKLSVLFPNIVEADAYFAQLKSKIDNDNNVWNVITDAANFKIPTQGYWDIKAWFAFVKRNQFSTRHMAFLRAASDIDMKMVLDDTIFCKHREAMLKQDQKDVQKFIFNILMNKLENLRGTESIQARNALWERLIQQCPLAYENLLNNYSKDLARILKQKREEKNKNSDLAQKSEAERLQFEAALLQEAKKELAQNLSGKKDKFQLLLKNIVELYDLRNPVITLPALVKLRLRDLPALSEEYKEAVCTALENGYSNEDIKRLTTYLIENKQVFTFVPSVVVDGAEINNTYNKCELRLLAKTDPMALVAGLKTRCCQHFNNAGVESAMHAYHSVYGATYRLAAKKDPNNGDWFAQSWTVLSECGTILLFDSIEFSGHAKEEMVLAFFKKACEKLLESNPHLQEIWVGASQHARLKLAKHGYTSKPVAENFSIAGYSKDSYTDSDKIVVLMRRTDLKETQEAHSVVLHVNSNAPKAIPEEAKQTQETKVNAEYRLRYGVDTYLKPGKVVKLLGLSEEARRTFNKTHTPVISLLMEDPENPLLEEGFVSSDPDHQENRYREGECFITYKAAMLWLENTLNPKLEALGLAHRVYAAKEENISSVLQTARQNTAIEYFTVVAFIGVHAVSIFVDSKNGVCFILDSEPGTNLARLSQACKDLVPNMRVIKPEEELRLQKDFYSCTTFALKSARYFAKNAETFSKLLQDNETDILATDDMPAPLLKMAQTPLVLMPEQQQTIVSKKKALILLQYNAALNLTIDGSSFNTGALKTRQNVLKQINSTMKPTQ